MKSIYTYCLLGLLWWPLLSIAQDNEAKAEQATEKVMDERVSLRRTEKAPYGTYYAYEYLYELFPDAEILIDKDPPREKYAFDQKVSDEIGRKISLYKGKSVQIVISHKVDPSEQELEALMNFVYDGNTAFLSSFYMGDLLLKKLGLTTHYNGGWADFEDSLKIEVVNPITSEKEMFSYPGMRLDNFFEKYTDNTTTILGRNRYGQPNFIKISFTDGGTIYLHLAPLAFSNFFLLHKNNKTYYDEALSYLPHDTKFIAWNEYFRTKDDNNGTSRAFSYMMKQPPLAAALWLLLLMFLLIFLFESKRKQRLIPVRPALKNSSLEFVKTIGQLYFQRHDNKNLAAKMTAHFLDHVRTRYNLSTSLMDESFEKKLAYKSGIEFKKVHDLIYQANYLHHQPTVSDVDLIEYNKHLENFYKKA